MYYLSTVVHGEKSHQSWMGKTKVNSFATCHNKGSKVKALCGWETTTLHLSLTTVSFGFGHRAAVSHGQEWARNISAVAHYMYGVRGEGKLV